MHASLIAFYAQLRQMSRQQHQRWVAAVAALMLVGTGGAFALVNLGPDPADLKVQQLLEAVTPLSADEQVQALEQAPLRLYRSELTRSSDTAESLLQRLGIADAQAAQFLRSNPQIRQALLGRAGRWVNAEADAQHRLLRLSAKWTADDSGLFQRLVVDRNANGFAVQQSTAPLTASVRMASGRIQSSLFGATDEARIPDAVAVQLVEIFSGDIDFHRTLRKGDRFSVVYETLEADGDPVRSGRVISAEFANGGKTYQAMWFEDPGTRKGSYYNLEGQSLRHAYLASPLAFSRVTSGFKMRFHPILQTWRAHLGVDYAAPVGTPVRSVGQGTVDVAGNQGGFGNVVMINHRNGHTTVYAHLSKVLVKKGQSIGQGETVGLVGATGWATGPHLHFEFRINGQHQDPQVIAKQSEAVPVSAQLRPEFLRQVQSTRQQLSAAATVQVTSIQ